MAVPTYEVDPRRALSLGGTVLILALLVAALFSSAYVVDPGHRGIIVTMGKVSAAASPEGFGFKAPFITTVIPVSVRQQTHSMKAECYSSDLQQITMDLKVLYRIPEGAVVSLFQDYAGDPFDNLIAPRVAEAVKEMTALQSAEAIVKKREDIKSKALEAARAKVGKLIIVEDIVIQNIALSKELEHAIEAKMVQEQEAAKSKFIQQKAETEANTAVIRAKGEAQSIEIRGRALKQAPALIQLQIVEKWDGKSPLVVGAGGAGANILLPLGKVPTE
jgi:prohibitin 2